jgi:hypothetical protein
MLSRVEEASGRVVTSDGTFMPSSLIRTIREDAKKTGHRKAFARGDRLLLPFAQAGHEVLPRSLSDSGTAERLGILGLATGGALGVGYESHWSPWSLLGLAAPYAAYQEPAMRAFQNWVGNASPGRRAAATAIRNSALLGAPPAGRVGGDFGEGLSDDR